MEQPNSVPDLIAAAQANAKTSENQIIEIRKQLDGATGSGAQADALGGAYVALEALAVDTFSVFEARMQHHFKRGPFSRKLKALLLNEGQPDLADRLHQYYLVVNVLKHGTGASYRELRDASNPFVPVKSAVPVKPAVRANSSETDDPDAENSPSSLIDIGVLGFFDGLAETLTQAYRFLEKR